MVLHSEIMHSDLHHQLQFHVKACVNKGRTLEEMLHQIHQSWGYRDQVTFRANKHFNDFING